MWFTDSSKLSLPDPAKALPGRAEAVEVPGRHVVNGAKLTPPYPDGSQVATFGMGCFWGAEKLFWEKPGVIVTAVGFAGGYTPNPTYREVCSGKTGHAEVVRVVFDPKIVSYEALLATFWENHDPTQGMRQGNDAGTQYRSAIYTSDDAQRRIAEASRNAYEPRLASAGYGAITTGIVPLDAFYFAEDDHQEYLAKNPRGYCPDHSTGVSCPIGLNVQVSQ
jgi:peptide-methionine (S)-S-oxide reductase